MDGWIDTWIDTWMGGWVITSAGVEACDQPAATASAGTEVGDQPAWMNPCVYG